MNQRFSIGTVHLFLLCLLIFPNIGFADYPDGYYEVQRVIDGNIFELTDGKQVRLIGIDAPEAGEACSDESGQHLSSLIERETVYLEKDVSETDHDGRLLRNVFVNGVFVNSELVYNGYAHAAEYPPDTKYASQLADAEEDAIENEKGCLWFIGCINCDGGGSTCIVVSSFMTTKTHGSPNDPHIKLLRSFRDTYLMPHRLGRKFVRFYYSCSPVVADYISKHEILKTLVRFSLLPIIGLCWVVLKLGSMAAPLVVLIFCAGLAYIIKSMRLKRRIMKTPIQAFTLMYEH